jgi:peroxiredoxin
MSASLTALLDRGRLVIVFGSQPWYLPYNHELQSLNEAVPRIRCADANLIAISPRSVAQNLKVWRECALNFPVLSDERNEIAEAFGLRIRFPDHLVGFSQKLGHESPALDEANNRTLAVRAQYLVNRDGTIVYSEIEPSFTSRLDLTGVMRVLESRIASRERRM